MAGHRSVTAEELQQHSSAEKCWLLVNGIVWDLTEFAPKHPGGAEIIHQYAGRDASETYNGIHAPTLIAGELDSSMRIGSLDISKVSPDSVIFKTPGVAATSLSDRRPLQTLISSHDFEQAASENLSAKAWAFFSSAATDCITKQANESYFGRIWLRPPILKDVSEVSVETTILGNRVGLPLFVSPTALVKLAHPEGEVGIAKGCSTFNIAQTISTAASFPLADITAAAEIPFFFQLYVNKNRSASEKLLEEAERCGARAVMVTVDQPTPAKREADERVKTDASIMTPTPNGAVARTDRKGSGLSRTMSGFIDSRLSWKDIEWLRSKTKLPLVLKGVQTAADAIRAVEHGIDGLLIGNHGGRSLDTSSPAILILAELQRTCPDIFKHIEVHLDGGIRRGTDMFKALCLGAKAVGMGRPFLYAANYGAEGVEQLIEIMKDEFETTMRMMGCTELSQLHPGLLNLGDVEHMIPRLSEAQPGLRIPKSRL